MWACVNRVACVLALVKGLSRWLCLKRVQRWLEASRIETGPLFRGVRVGGAVGELPLVHQTIREIVKARAEAAGVGPENPSLGRVSDHSLRDRVPPSRPCGVLTGQE